MVWKIKFTTSAEKDFSKISKDMQKRIVKYFKEKVMLNPRANGSALQGADNIKLWRYRIGDYRSIAQINDFDVIVLVVRIGKRDSIYKSLS